MMQFFYLKNLHDTYKNSKSSQNFNMIKDSYIWHKSGLQFRIFMLFLNLKEDYIKFFSIFHCAFFGENNSWKTSF